jgi:chemotaxis signal transduction protein
MDEFSTTGEAQVSPLDQLSDEQFWEYARALADRASSTTLAQEYLECILSNGRCLVPLAALDEVLLSPHRFAFLPAAPQWMAGLTAWHGETIAVIDLDAYLSQQPTGRRSAEGMMLIAHDDGRSLAILVSAIGSTLPMHEAEDSATDASLELPAWYLPSRASCAQGVLADAVILNIPLLLAKALEEIEIPTAYE